jgi:hypothetical protein
MVLTYHIRIGKAELWLQALFYPSDSLVQVDMYLFHFCLATAWRKLHTRFVLEELEFIAVKVGVLFSAPNIQDGNYFGGKFNVRLTVCGEIGFLDTVFGKWRKEIETSVSSAMGIKGGEMAFHDEGGQYNIDSSFAVEG